MDMGKENENQGTVDDFADCLTDQKRKELEEDLASLSPDEQDTLERVIKHHPDLTPLEALWHLRAGGM
jgi:hypothetical protein